MLRPRHIHITSCHVNVAINRYTKPPSAFQNKVLISKIQITPSPPHITTPPSHSQSKSPPAIPPQDTSRPSQPYFLQLPSPLIISPSPTSLILPANSLTNPLPRTCTSPRTSNAPSPSTRTSICQSRIAQKVCQLEMRTLSSFSLCPLSSARTKSASWIARVVSQVLRL
jgi:hypothetical protein